MEQARAHGRLGDAGDGGRLRRRQLFDLAQHEGDALGQRQPIQRGPKLQAQLAPVGLLLRVARWNGLRLDKRASARCRLAAARRWWRARLTAIASRNVSSATSPRNPRTARGSAVNVSWTTSSAAAASESSRRASTRTR